ncbi:MAG: phosphoenolpyruvate--protein phosphotransferase [Clostridiaceae bacterium]|jgi:phosphotransferase system enzyme I (PtsI)|nr:phosphoenolpyruvate--protein phosphotransferase [Bacillota bacterium]NLN52054.1 phosphoenolpyruvate--protein phosphotransferase [Clostridiaceae bacterium]
MKHIKVQRTFTRGIAEAEAFVYEKTELKASQNLLRDEFEIQDNLKFFEDAVNAVSEDLNELAEESAIFAGHLSIANDIALKEAVISKIKDEKQNAELALENTIQEFSAMMSAIDDAYMQERATDIEDVGARFMAALQGEEFGGLDHIQKEVIIIAEDLTPSDTSSMNFDYVKGFITEKGGVTSHVSIIARSLGLPALVGASTILENVQSGDTILFDAESGDIYINPEAQIRTQLLEKAEAEAVLKEQIAARVDLPVITEDGKKLKVYANVGSAEEIQHAMEYKINGVGLFRTEFLFMENKDFPSEEEQFEAYKSAVEALDNEIIIRTLDIGGDKELPYYEFEAEENPFLGWRAVRMCLEEIDVFKTQLRALLRAAVYGPIKIMIPMIISVEEVDQVNKIIDLCKAELRAEGVEYKADVPVGIMIETPAAVMIADKLAKVVDFFSIGTNDLTQYVLAVDRGNKRIEHLYDSFHPAVLRAINQVIKAANAEGIEVGMCGEFASDQNITEVLLGFGLDEYSMAASETPIIKEKIRNLNFVKAQELAEKVLASGTIKEVYDLLGME